MFTHIHLLTQSFHELTNIALHTYLFYYSFVRCKIFVAENPDLKTIFVRNNKQNSDKAITKLRNCKFWLLLCNHEANNRFVFRTSHASTLNLLSIIVYPHSSSDSIFPWANRSLLHTNLFIIHLYNVRFSLLNENAEKTDLKSIFGRNNKKNSDILITKNITIEEKIKNKHKMNV